ncbi:hypothetical protein FQZ97_1057230 [compost metagenome]
MVPKTGNTVATPVTMPHSMALFTPKTEYPIIATRPWHTPRMGIPIALVLTIILISVQSSFLLLLEKGKKPSMVVSICLPLTSIK